MVDYNNFSQTFSNSRKNLKWHEISRIIEDIKHRGYTNILDVGCGNGRFLGEIQNSELELQSYLGIDASTGMIQEARELYPQAVFELHSMESLSTLKMQPLQFDAMVFIASFHHLETRESRIVTLRQAKELLAPDGRIYMTNWNLLDQQKYLSSHRGGGDFDVKIGQYRRYYHGFCLAELSEIFSRAGLHEEENRIFEGGKNIISILSH